MPGAYGGIEFTLVGVKDVIAELNVYVKEVPELVGASLEAEADIELDASKQIVPELSGDLLRSATRHDAVIAGNDISVRMTYGNEDVPYAVIQHEKLQYEHDDGEAKYLESVLRASRVFILPRLARRIAAKLGEL